VSPSKKANKKEIVTKPKNAQKPEKKNSARSSRVNAKNVQTEAANTTQEQASAKKRSTSLWTNLFRVVALLLVVGITVYIYRIRDHVKDFEQFGYAGIFLIALMSNATVLLPAPGVAIIYAMGAVFNPLWVGLAAGTGGALGELSGFLAGFSGQPVVERTDIYNRFKPWVDKYGGWTILVLSAIPNPFFDVAGIAAGIAKMPIQTFLLFTWAGQIIKMLMFAFAGHYSLEWLANFIR
jgi:uncharacterized membrane protein YdjX (TVP38/TMEM64 family)